MAFVLCKADHLCCGTLWGIFVLPADSHCFFFFLSFSSSLSPDLTPRSMSILCIISSVYSSFVKLVGHIGQAHCVDLVLTSYLHNFLFVNMFKNMYRSSTGFYILSWASWLRKKTKKWYWNRYSGFTVWISVYKS